MTRYPTVDSPGDLRTAQPNTIRYTIRSSDEFKALMKELLQEYPEPSKQTLKDLETFAEHATFSKLFGVANKTRNNKDKGE